MAFLFSTNSKKQLATCHPDLQVLFTEVIKYFDCIVIEGHRGEAAQNAAYNKGNSKLRYPNGKHNKLPSMAADVAPYNRVTKNISWTQTNDFYYFAGHVMAIAIQLYNAGRMKHRVTFGGDWNRNNNLRDQTFMDLVHYEIVI